MATEAEQLKKVKDPDAVLDYVIDWSEWLPEGDTITDADWTPESGITVDSSSHTTTTTTVWLSGGTDGTQYTVTAHITTAGGRQDDRSLTIKCREQ